MELIEIGNGAYYRGDCLTAMRGMLDAGMEGTIHSVVTDPPYHLTTGKQVGSTGFMGKSWDGGDIAFQKETWELALALLRPGGHLAAFGGTRTCHRLTCAIEDAGFEVRDRIRYECAAETKYGALWASLTDDQRGMLAELLNDHGGTGEHAWQFGTGFPKSLNVSAAIDKRRDDRSDILGVTAFIAMARDTAGMKNSDIDAAFGTNGMAGKWTSKASQPAVPKWDQWLKLQLLLGFGDEMDAEVWRLNCRKGQPGEAWHEREVVGAGRGGTADAFGAGTWASLEGTRTSEPYDITAPAADAARKWNGFGTALKPAYEVVVVGRKPLEGTVARNVLRHGAGVINIDGCRVPGEGTLRRSTAEMGFGGGNLAEEYETGSSLGRWPANVIQDGSPEIMDAYAAFGTKTSGSRSGSFGNGTFSSGTVTRDLVGDTGTAARFFYSAKASRKDRQGRHPTQKPLSLMRYLCRMHTPPGGVILDPFSGSGSTLEAAIMEGFQAVGCELTPEYFPDIEARLRRCQPDLLPEAVPDGAA